MMSRPDVEISEHISTNRDNMWHQIWHYNYNILYMGSVYIVVNYNMNYFNSLRPSCIINNMHSKECMRDSHQYLLKFLSALHSFINGYI